MGISATQFLNLSLALHILSLFGAIEVMSAFARMRKNFTLITFALVYAIYALYLLLTLVRVGVLWQFLGTGIWINLDL